MESRVRKERTWVDEAMNMGLSAKRVAKVTRKRTGERLRAAVIGVSV
jgi:hypothetical protein